MSALMSTRLRRIALGVGVVFAFAVVGLFASAWLLGRSGAHAGRAPAAPQGNPLPGSYDPAALRSITHSHLGRHQSVIATARGKAVALHHRPRGRSYRRLGPLPHSYGTRPVFLVKRRRPGWLLVYLPIRPNKSTAWVRASAVRLSVTTYRIDIELRKHRLTVWRGAHRALRTKIGVGKAVTPTPAGRYYLVYLLRPPDPGGEFGKYAFGLSAYSKVLTSFAGGDGEVGLHGTNDPAGIGTDVSHGCIRVSNRTITRLARRLPLGTPLTIEH